MWSPNNMQSQDIKKASYLVVSGDFVRNFLPLYFQGLREAIKNSDVDAVRKLLSKVSIFIIQSLCFFVVDFRLNFLCGTGCGC